MRKLRHKVRNGLNIPPLNQISSISNLVFQIKIYILMVDFQQHIASIRL